MPHIQNRGRQSQETLGVLEKYEYKEKYKYNYKR